MSTATLPEIPPSLDLPLDGLYRLSVEQYHQIADAGILTESDRVELIEGMLVKKVTIYPRHAFLVQSLVDIFAALAIPGWCYRSQQPITLPTSEPEPDGALVRGRNADYRARHPEPPEIGIVVEVAESSLPQDRGVKKRMYARAGIPVYWIVNAIDNCVEAFSNPRGGEYQTEATYHLSQRMRIELDGQSKGEISVATLFGE
jgi:Uma2 family endonuclease